MYIGWDWASESHDVSAVDEDGKLVLHLEVEHTEAGLVSVLRRLRRLGEPADLPVAIERPSGLVVERLLAQGHPVMPIHPNTFNAVRARWGASRGKSDAGDSYRLADFLRTDGHSLRRAEPLSEVTRNLQALVRSRDDQVESRVATCNQLAALLDAHWPGAGAVFQRLDSEIALAFLEAYPTPESAARLNRSTCCGQPAGRARWRASWPAFRAASWRLVLALVQTTPSGPQIAERQRREFVAAQLHLDVEELVDGVSDVGHVVVVGRFVGPERPTRESVQRGHRRHRCDPGSRGDLDGAAGDDLLRPGARRMRCATRRAARTMLGGGSSSPS